MAYRDDRAWSDQFIPAIKRIVGPLLLEAAPLEIDNSEATDLLVFRARDMRIAARVRRHGYAERYSWQFTIRSARDSGAKTELSKIVEGWGDWLFYGHACEDNGGISRWLVIDLHVLRAALIRREKNRPIRGNKANGDGTYFAWFDVLSFAPTPPILVASSHDSPKCEAAA